MTDPFKTASASTGDDGAMTKMAIVTNRNIDVQAAASFMATHARLLDRHRFELLVGDSAQSGAGGAGADRALAALDAYRNPDGGYSWGLEADLRAPESQPGAALHAFEAFAEVAERSGRTSPRAVELCDWLGSVTLADGGIPFALPVGNAAGTAPFWADADPSVSSLQITAIVATMAQRLARHDSAVAQHPWLATANRYCVDAIGAIDTEPFALVLSFSLQFLDALATDEARRLASRLMQFVPASGHVAVAGGTADETVGPLDFAPFPGGPVSELVPAGALDAALDELARQQQPDGGWPVVWRTYSPAAELEWRGYLTIRALTILTSHARKDRGR